MVPFNNYVICRKIRLILHYRVILYTFFDEYDLSGKTIVPFGTHGGSGFAGTIDIIAELEPDANVMEDGLTISRDHIEDAENDIAAWVENIGL